MFITGALLLLPPPRAPRKGDSTPNTRSRVPALTPTPGSQARDHTASQARDDYDTEHACMYHMHSIPSGLSGSKRTSHVDCQVAWGLNSPHPSAQRAQRWRTTRRAPSPPRPPSSPACQSCVRHMNPIYRCTSRCSAPPTDNPGRSRRLVRTSRSCPCTKNRVISTCKIDQVFGKRDLAKET